MGKYDIFDKKYFKSMDRMADLISVGIFHGKLSVSADDLILIDGSYPSLSGKGELSRDAICFCPNHRIKYGLEIESHSDYRMPRRVMIYDACEYEKEADELYKNHLANSDFKTFEEIKSKMKKDEKLYGVLTFVLYLSVGHYKGNVSLKNCMHKIPENIIPFVYDKIPNYGFVLIEADYVNPDMFKTDLRQFFMAMQARNNKDRLFSLLLSEEYSNLPRETQQVICIHLGYKELIPRIIKEDVDMCKAIRDMLRDVKNEGITEGHAAGLTEGRAAGLTEGRAAGLTEGRAAGLTEGRAAGLSSSLACVSDIKNGLNKAALLAKGYDEDIVEAFMNILCTE